MFHVSLPLVRGEEEQHCEFRPSFRPETFALRPAAAASLTCVCDVCAVRALQWADQTEQ